MERRRLHQKLLFLLLVHSSVSLQQQQQQQQQRQPRRLLLPGALEVVQRQMALLYPDDTFANRARACDQRLEPGRTYGEFTEFPDGLSFFYDIVETCRQLHACSGSELAFVDLGSGAGRAVLSASLLWEWRRCDGIEVSAPLHDLALTAASRMPSAFSSALGGGGGGGGAAAAAAAADSPPSPSPVAFHRYSFEDSAAQHLLAGLASAEIDHDHDERAASRGVVAFAYSTAFPTDPETGALSWLARALRTLPAGSLVATVDHPLVLEAGRAPTRDASSRGRAEDSGARKNGGGGGGGDDCLFFVGRGELVGSGCYGAPGLDARAFIYERTAHGDHR